MVSIPSLKVTMPRPHVVVGYEPTEFDSVFEQAGEKFQNPTSLARDESLEFNLDP